MDISDLFELQPLLDDFMNVVFSKQTGLCCHSSVHMGSFTLAIQTRHPQNKQKCQVDAQVLFLWSHPSAYETLPKLFVGMAVFAALEKALGVEASGIIFSFLEDSSEINNCTSGVGDIANLDDVELSVSDLTLWCYNRSLNHDLYHESLECLFINGAR